LLNSFRTRSPGAVPLAPAPRPSRAVGLGVRLAAMADTSPSPPRTPEASQRPSPGAHAEEVRHTSSATLRSDARGNAYLNQYVVIKDLGRGAFGKVKLCLNTQTNELCALKCINRKLLRRMYAGQGEDKGAQAVRKEIAIMKKLSHENVVRLREVIDDAQGQYVFMALEYVSGGPLYDPTQYGGKGMGEDLARKYFRSVCVGLAYLHANGIIHRDLKPDNLLKQADGTVKITDFGVSELFEETGEAPGTPGVSSSSTSGSRTVSAAVGTPAFLAPEVARGGRARGAPRDVWSMGVCLYYVVSATEPFPGSTVESVIAKITARDEDEDAHSPRRDVLPGDGRRSEIALGSAAAAATAAAPRRRSFLDALPGSASDSLRDLLARVLDKNPDTRLDLPGIAKHAWVTNRGREPLRLDVDRGGGGGGGGGGGASPLASLVVSDAEVKSSISYERVGVFFDDSEALVRQKTFARGDFLIKQGERGDEMFVILEGEVEVLSPKPVSKKKNNPDEDEVDMSDDIVAAAMMNRDASRTDLISLSGEKDDTDETPSTPSARDWFRCCLGSRAKGDGSRDESESDFDFESASDSEAPRGSTRSSRVVIAKRGAGDVIGEMSLLTETSDSTRSASVRAVSDAVRCSVISKEELWKSFRKRPEVLEELRLRSTGRESELMVNRARLRTEIHVGG